MQNAGVDRGTGEIVLNDSESTSNDEYHSRKKHKKHILSNETLFKKLKDNIAARSNLSSIHAARAYKYGHVQFGPKSWYKESSNISSNLTVQEDRRKFRQGLKCNVDFLNQLNMHDLMANLIDGSQDITSLPETRISRLGEIFECLKNVPMIDILKLIDNEKAKKIFTSIDKIVALAHVSQSMGNYFARDDSLDPALSTVCQALRGSNDFEFMLRTSGGTFQSLASTYYHLKSTTDRDVSGSTQTPRAKGYNRDRPTSKTSKKRHCWIFQRNGRCSRRDCSFSHRCQRCNSKNHGERQCRSGGGRN